MTFGDICQMKLFQLLGATALISTLPLTPAMAQSSPPPAQEGQAGASPADAPVQNTTTGVNDGEGSNATTGQDVTVTGTRIRTPNATSPIPITTIPVETLTQTGRTSIGDVLNDLPQLNSTFSQSNSTRFLGTGGLNLLDLRGLGTVRTLVLVNGRRHVGADILNNATGVDVNTIPTDLIESVEIVTGANSAVYGSDALAGVVNFRLKRDFDGLLVRGQGSISDEGDAGTYFTSVTAGKNFAEGRGNLAVNLEYTHTEDLFASDRREYRRTDGFITTDSDTPGAGTSGNLNFDGIPDSTFFRDIRSATISDGGLVSFATAVPTATGNAPVGRDVTGRAFPSTFLFQPGGALVAQTGTRVGLIGGTVANPAGTGAGTSFIGGNGNTRREGVLVQLLPRLDRYAANLLGHFDISDAFIPFVEAKYVRTRSVSLGGSGPAFYTGSTIDLLYERPRLDNPFLSADSRNFLSGQALNAVNNGRDPNTGNAFAVTRNSAGVIIRTAAENQAIAADQIANGSYRFILRKNLTDLGSRSEDATRETYRIVGGVRGDIAENLNYEISANYGEFKERTRVQGNIDTQRLSLALDAVRNPAGQIVCGSQTDAARGLASAQQVDAGIDRETGLPTVAGQAILNANIAACQPLNPFGLGSISEAARNYVLRDTTSRGKITQFDALGILAGDTSSFFSLPGGAPGFSIGAEYRRETNSFRADPLVEAGYTFYNALAPFNPPAFEVKEAFGELRLPLVKDFPLIQELTVSGAGRVSDYKGSAGTAYAYNLNAEWSPIRDIRFRANYGRGVRAPNLTELYSAAGQNFAPGFADPCSAINIASGTQFRAANCQAAGIPTSYDFRYQQSLETVSSGNQNLNVEKSDSYTYGAVLQPRFTPGLTLSVDYYNIKVKNVIFTPSAQQLANACYDSPSITDNQFCSLFTRAGADGGPNGEQQFRIIEGSLQQQPLNYAALRVRGIDVNANYVRSFGGIRVSGQVIYTHYLENAAFTNPASPGFGDNFVGELGTPEDQVQVNLNASFGTFYLDTQFRYLSKQSIGAIENLQNYQGRPPQNLDAFFPENYPDVLYIAGRVGVNINDQSRFYVGVDNLTDRLPPLGTTGIGGGSAIFDNVGRRFYAGVSARF